MKENRIAFIICSNNIEIRIEITKYINRVILPKGYEKDIIVIEDATSMTEGYNRALKQSDAKYKIYMHHDIFLINSTFLEEAIRIFMQNPQVGLLGVIGCKRLSRSGIWWEGEKTIGRVIEDKLECLTTLDLGEVTGDFEEVQALDGQFLMTQYDIPWREDVCQGWHFYDTSQCLEFAKAGYKVAVVNQRKPWLIHECGMDFNTGYEEERDKFLREYKIQIENRDFLFEEKIGVLINEGRLEEAKELLEEYKTIAYYNDNMAIFEASLYFSENKTEEAFQCIAKGLSYNCRNYELYFMLGNYYSIKNKNQAFLCYENAEYYCYNEDKEYINHVKEELVVSGEASVKPVSVVVLSYNGLEVTALCLDSIYQSMYGKAGEIIVIDNASCDGSAQWLMELEKSEQAKTSAIDKPKIKVICNQENKGFPAGCNQGIIVAEPANDIFLLNNDTIVPANAIFWLRMALYEEENVGSAGSVSNHANNDQMVKDKKGSPESWYKYGEEINIPMIYPYERKAWLMGFAVMFKRQILDRIGYLDERFSPGNYEDNDIGFRLLKAGYTQLLCKNSFIFHFGSIGFRKNQKEFEELLARNRNKLIQKHGFEVDNHCWVRTDMLSLIKEEDEAEFRLLEIGCALGATLAKVQSMYPHCEAIGIEKVKQIAEIGGTLAHIIQGDIETMTMPFEMHSFDYILIGNVLEYLSGPKDCLLNLSKYLKQTGQIILSVSKNYKHHQKVLTMNRTDIEELLPACDLLVPEWIPEDEKRPDYLLKLTLNNN